MIRKERIRICGIDAPEAAQLCRNAQGQSWKCGQCAALALDTLMGAAPISCRRQGRDWFGRTLATCRTSDGTDVGAWMVAHGWAMAYRKYSTIYVPAEEEARAQRLGIWEGRCVPPWDWRKHH